MAKQQLPQDLYRDFLHSSQDYWLDVRGDMDPPAPSYRQINGKAVLGRYMDPWGAQGLMYEAKVRWEQWYPSFLVNSAIGPLFTGVTWVFTILILPFLAVWYLVKRSYFRRQYDRYYRVLEECERTNQPVWVPFDKDRLKLIEARPQAVWP